MTITIFFQTGLTLCEILIVMKDGPVNRVHTTAANFGVRGQAAYTRITRITSYTCWFTVSAVEDVKEETRLDDYTDCVLEAESTY